MKFTVVGAGLSGLAAAHRLTDEGHEVTVLESNAFAGGRCRRIERDGFIIDTGPDLVSNSYQRYLALVKKVGLGADVVPTSTVASFVRNGRLIDVDTERPLSAVFTPLLSWPAKLKTLRAGLKLRDLVSQADAYNLVALAAHEDPAVSAGALARRSFGDEAADYLIDAVLRPLGGTHMDSLSSLLLVGALASWTEPLLTVRGGLNRVAELAANQLNVTYNAKVSEISEAAGGVEVAYVTGGESRSHVADGCVVATQYHDAERLYPRFGELAGDYGARLRYCGLIDLKLAYSVGTQSDACAVFLPTVESSELLMYALIHNKSDDRVPAGKSLFTVYTDAGAFARFDAMSDDAIVAWGREHVERFHPELSGHFLFSHVLREPQTAYDADAGFYGRTQKLLTALEQSRRVQLGGDVFAGGSLEAAVVWGERAADRLRRLIPVSSAQVGSRAA